MHSSRCLLSGLLLWVGCAGADEVPRTPLGAAVAGDAAAGIPAWTGGIGTASGPELPDPFAADVPLLTIERSNVAAHAGQLSHGQQAMFKRYPGWRMQVWPTRRSAGPYPPAVLAAIARNSSTARLVAAGNGIADARLGIPFPTPQDGAQAIWNHRLRYQPATLVRDSIQVVPTATGAYTPIRLSEQLHGPYWHLAGSAPDPATDPVLRYLFVRVSAPARLAGQMLLVHEPLLADVARQAWVYNPGQRRVRKAPDIAYDTPGTAAEGLRSADMFDLFSGAMDRFDWTLKGQQVLIVPYNNHALQAALDDPGLVRAGHLDLARVRYERHRVWVVEARVKAGLRHQMPHRTLYLDEDSWQVLVVDHYDSADQLWRYSEAATLWDGARAFLWTVRETHHDLKSGRYVSVGSRPGKSVAELSPADFTPAAMRQR